MIDRRTLMGAAAAALAMPVASQADAQDVQGESLKYLAKQKGILFGSATGIGPANTLGASQRDATYRLLLAKECGALVCENEMKWVALRPNEAEFNFEGADAIVAFAAQHDMAMRGHTLLWHHPQWFPDWLTNYDFGATPASQAERLLTTHIRRVCDRYPQVVSWDVINETVDPDTGGLRTTSLSRAMGEDVLDVAFHTAREAAPKAQLVYNDYMSWEAGHETHRAGVLRLLEGFKARGVPVDALGVQSHIGSGNTDGSVGFDTAQESLWRRFMDEVTGMGFKIAMTEFDVHDKNLPADIAYRDREVASLAGRYLDLMLDYPQTQTLMVWGLSDRNSWLQNLWPRADGRPKRPTPFDANYRAKPLRQSMAEAIGRAQPRPALI